MSRSLPLLLKDVDEVASIWGWKKSGRLRSSVQRGRFTKVFVDERLQLITPVFDYDAFSGVD